MSKILVVDDEPNVRSSIAELLAEQGYDVLTADRGETALAVLDHDQPDLMVCDIQMPGMNGLDAFRILRKSYPKLPVIIMTAYGTTETAIEATKLGAFDYQLKPFDPDEMLRTVERALESVRLMHRQVRIDPGSLPATDDAIIGQSACMQDVYKAIGRVAQTDASVLIRGETGTGKELIARAVYQHSNRAERPLLVVNCVAIPDTLLEAELFGHEKGAFTGAATRRIGKFEQANGGTLFLDEIGDIPLTTQAKLLRVLQERSFERIGSNETIHVDVRVLAATNRDLEHAIANGRFREDLFHRLNVVTIRVPALRERRNDIPRLTNYFLELFSRKLGIDKPAVSDDALDVLVNYDWPGNVRELEHTIHRALIFTHGYPIQRTDILQALEQRPEEAPAPTATATVGQSASIRVGMKLEEVEREFIKMTLAATSGNKKQAAKMLGISRRAVYDKLKKYGLQ
jgi:nitrogen regulation protein NR(I)